MIGSREDIGALWIYAHIGTGLKKQVQAGFTVWWKDKRLDSTTFAQYAGPWEVTEDLTLKRRQEGFHARGGDAVIGLGVEAIVVVLNGELGYFAFPVTIVEDEEREAGVAEQAPGLGRVRRSCQRKERRLLLVTEVDDQTGEGGQQRRHVMSVCAGRERQV